MACKNRGLIEKRIRNCVGEEILLCFAGDGLAVVRQLVQQDGIYAASWGAHPV